MNIQFDPILWICSIAKSFHCPQTSQETTWILDGNAKHEDWP